ncbi:MAG: T9SS type A sorting domain-containing protein, partial [Chitinophagales bacterium]
ATGKVYSRQTFNGQAGDNYINIYPTGASAGMYILNINGNTISQTIKLIKQ